MTGAACFGGASTHGRNVYGTVLLPEKRDGRRVVNTSYTVLAILGCLIVYYYYLYTV